ncbi:MAG: hypothetical protein GF311_20370 [Candidatus Lokiarchaeota archaeon]|nr:hypothetical protein [Candidatus Lokiarchaeota archaeon]
MSTFPCNMWSLGIMVIEAPIVNTGCDMLLSKVIICGADCAPNILPL